MNIDKAVFLITGAANGLGKGLCKYFVSLGAKVVAIDIDEKNLLKLEKELAKGKGSLKPFCLDITDLDGIEDVINKSISELKTIDVLINNAAIRVLKPFEDLEKGEIDKMIDVALKGTIYLTQIVSRIMIKNKKGHIFNISSMAGLKAVNKNASIYTAAKFGITGFSEAIAKYLIDYGIHVVNLCPGGINTAMWRDCGYIFGNENKKYLMDPKEIAEVIEFILTRKRETTMFKNMVFFPFCEIERY